MRLLRVISSMNPSMGGPCQGIRNSIPELQKIGVYNEVLCLDDPNAPFLQLDRFIIHALGPSTILWAYCHKLIPWLLKNYSRFDAIIVHGLWEYHSYAVNKVISNLKKDKKSKIPKVYIMPHGMLDPYSLKYKGSHFKIFRKVLYWKQIESKAINNADGILFTCQEELRLASKTFDSYTPKCEMNIGYGIEAPPDNTINLFEAFMEKCPNLREEKYLLFLGRIHEKKAVELLVKAYLDLAKDTSRDMPKLVIAGPGLETSYGRKIQVMVKSHNMRSQDIFFPGMLIGNEKWGAFYGCEAFVLPSHQENFGIAVVEALACGRPVLISNQINIWREIENLGGGMVADDTYTGVRQLLNSWISLDEGEKLQMRVSAITSYNDKFSISLHALQMKEALLSDRKVYTI